MERRRRLESKTQAFGSQGAGSPPGETSRGQCWRGPQELGGFFLASKSFLISSSFLARFGIFKQKRDYYNFVIYLIQYSFTSLPPEDKWLLYKCLFPCERDRLHSGGFSLLPAGGAQTQCLEGAPCLNTTPALASYHPLSPSIPAEWAWHTESINVVQTDKAFA